MNRGKVLACILAGAMLFVFGMIVFTSRQAVTAKEDQNTHAARTDRAIRDLDKMFSGP
jgi:hypothetical protein